MTVGILKKYCLKIEQTQMILSKEKIKGFDRKKQNHGAD